MLLNRLYIYIFRILNVSKENYFSFYFYLFVDLFISIGSIPRIFRGLVKSEWVDSCNENLVSRQSWVSKLVCFYSCFCEEIATFECTEQILIS